MINKDLKDNIPEQTKMSPEDKSRLINLFKTGWDALHRYFLYVIIAIVIGIYIGISASRIYFDSKMTDATKIGGMVFREKVYIIQLK